MDAEKAVDIGKQIILRERQRLGEDEFLRYLTHLGYGDFASYDDLTGNLKLTRLVPEDVVMLAAGLVFLRESGAKVQQELPF